MIKLRILNLQIQKYDLEETYIEKLQYQVFKIKRLVNKNFCVFYDDSDDEHEPTDEEEYEYMEQERQEEIERYKQEYSEQEHNQSETELDNEGNFSTDEQTNSIRVDNSQSHNSLI